MITLSLRRKDSSTAFLIHWYGPLATPWRLATRSLPTFSSAITCSTASRTSCGAEGREAGAVVPRGVDDGLELLGHGSALLVLDELHDAAGGFEALGGVGHERHPDAAGAGIHARGVARR